MAQSSPSVLKLLAVVYCQPMTWVGIIGGLAFAFVAEQVVLGLITTALIGGWGAIAGVEDAAESA
jgi:hypothetical protein